MNNYLSKMKYFRVNELNHEVVLLSTQLPYIRESNIVFLLEAMKLVQSCYKKIILDISKIDDIDTPSFTLLDKQITKVSSQGGSVKLIVSEDKPIISYSRGNDISKFEIFLDMKTALNGEIN